MVNWNKMFEAVGETLYMTLITTIFVVVIGLALGLILFFTKKDGLKPNRIINGVIQIYVNVARALPFVILLIILIPFTRSIMGTILGPSAALPALIIGASPFYARIVELALNEIDGGVIEAVESLGANRFQLIIKVLIPEAMPALISGLTVTIVTLIGYTALAGVIGAGGLGNLAYLHGFQRRNYSVMWIAVVFILVFVFLVQFVGDFVSKKIDKR